MSSVSTSTGSVSVEASGGGVALGVGESAEAVGVKTGAGEPWGWLAGLEGGVRVSARAVSRQLLTVATSPLRSITPLFKAATDRSWSSLV